jgi:hypothetical protein
LRRREDDERVGSVGMDIDTAWEAKNSPAPAIIIGLVVAVVEVEFAAGIGWLRCGWWR